MEQILFEPNIAKALQYYEERYVGVDRFFLRPGTRLELPTTEPRSCRFCGRNSTDTRFSQRAHAIPELLGNRFLFTREECDECNSQFGKTIENDLGNWTKPMRTFSRIRGKRGIPTLKDEREGWRIEYTETAFNITQYESNPLFTVDEDQRRLELQLKRDPFTPVAVLKAFVRVGLTLLPHDELKNFDEALSWVRNPVHARSLVSEFPVLYTFQPGPMPNDLIVVLLMRRRATRQDVPYAFLVLAYGNETYQVFLPSLRQDRPIDGQKLNLPAFPVPPGPDPQRYGQPNTRLIDLCGREIVRNEAHPIFIGFEHLEVEPSH